MDQKRYEMDQKGLKYVRRVLDKKYLYFAQLEKSGHSWNHLENWQSSGKIRTVLKSSGKLVIIWKIRTVLKSPGKLAVIWKNRDSFEIIWKIGSHLENPDSFEIIRKIGSHLEKSG